VPGVQQRWRYPFGGQPSRRDGRGDGQDGQRQGDPGQG
jgi:hypothetical protein